MRGKRLERGNGSHVGRDHQFSLRFLAVDPLSDLRSGKVSGARRLLLQHVQIVPEQPSLLGRNDGRPAFLPDTQNRGSREEERSLTSS